MRSWAWIVLLAGSCRSVPAQTDKADPLILLGRIKQHMVNMLAHQPNYTCVETVERSGRTSATRKFQVQDTLRLEVALVDGKEMFAWPGSKKFDDVDPGEFVQTGVFGNGDFALHARSVFGSNAPTYNYRGQVQVEGRTAEQFDFLVKRLVSGFIVRVGQVEHTIGYSGSFFVDTVSLDLIRLDLVADDVPADLGLSRITDRMDYALVRIGEGSFLLPASSELITSRIDGQEHRNQVRFSSCRQYAGESVLSFEDPDEDPDAPETKPEAVKEVTLPRDLVLIAGLSEDIDSTSIAVGDVVHAELKNDLKYKKEFLVKKGARLTGRISKVQHDEEGTFIGFTFSELEAPGIHANLLMSFDRAGGLEALVPRRRPGPAPAPALHEALISVRNGRVRLNRGILLFWRTDE